LDGIKGSAQFGIRRYGLQVPYHCHGYVKGLAELVQGTHGIAEGPLAGLVCQRFEARSGIFQQGGDRRFHAVRPDLIEGDMKGKGEERIRICRRRHHLRE
jgi:hypothetical protein